MKIIIRFCKSWGDVNTFPLDLDENAGPNELMDKIRDKFKLKSDGFILRYSRDGFMIRITPSFPISFYCLKEKTVIYVEKVENSEDKQRNTEARINFRYFEKLGLLNSITEEEEKDRCVEEGNGNSSSTVRNFESFKKSPSSLDSKHRSPSSNSGLQKTEKSFEVKNYLEGQIEMLLRETKKGNKEEIIQILETLTEIIPEQFLEEVIAKKKRLFDEPGTSGWNAFHFAVFYGKSDICTIFLERKADVNKKTLEEGWTPLQLAVQKNHAEIVKLLLKSPSIDVNQVTPKGTALHLACKYNRPGLALMILASNGCDPDIKNSEGYVAADLTNNAEIAFACESKSKIPKEPMRAPSAENEIDESITKPPIVTGLLYKIGKSQVTLNLRYFVLNADDGTFIRFRKKADYPLKPLEIIALKDIVDLTFKKKAGFLLSDKYKYIEIKTRQSTQTLACSYTSTLKAWVKHLNDGRNFCLFIEAKLNNMKESKDDEGLYKFINRLSLSKKEYTITIEDQEKEEDRSMNWFSNKANSPPSKIKTLQPKAKVQSSQDFFSPPVENTRTTTNAQKELGNSLGPRRKLSSPIPENKRDFMESNEPNEQFTLAVNTVPREKINFKAFKIIKVLGSGAFGKVFLVKKKDTGKIYAMKALRKRTLHLKKQMKYAISEANILKSSKHPFILGLHYCFQTPQFLYMILDYCSAGDLSLILAQQPESKFEEDIAKFFICELVLAIEYLHNRNIIYRDLKPENILIHHDGHIKLADFGLSKEGVGDGDRTKSFCGSPAYLSPEMVRNKGASKATDIYGIGTVLYEMIVGSPPFYDDDLKTMYRNIDEGNLLFPSHVSEEAKDLIKKLMSKDPEVRLGLKNKDTMKSHPFFDGVDWNKVLSCEYDPPQVIDQEEEKVDFNHEMGHVIDHDYDDFNMEVNRVNDFSFSEF